MKTRTYSDLSRIDSFEDRFEYLVLGGSVAHSTFGFDRYLNQEFYNSVQWRQVRNFVIVRDDGCDLGVPGYDVHDRIVVHHMNPITEDDIIHGEDWILDPEFLITTTHDTHNAIHYGDKTKLVPRFKEREPGDTKLW